MGEVDLDSVGVGVIAAEEGGVATAPEVVPATVVVLAAGVLHGTPLAQQVSVLCVLQYSHRARALPRPRHYVMSDINGIN